MIKIINKFEKINKSLIGYTVNIKNRTYPETKEVIRKINKITNLDIKQICFYNNINPILIRKSDKFTIEIINN